MIRNVGDLLAIDRSCGRAVSGAVFLLFGLVAPAWAGLDPPDSPPDTVIAQFLSRNQDEELLILQQWIGFDVQWKRNPGGLFGEWQTLESRQIGDRSAIEAASVVQVTDDPLRRLKDVTVEVFRAGAPFRAFRRKDLRWAEMTQRGDGVVVLDGVMSHALIPGLQVGDRVRVHCEYELKGIHGFGQWPLGWPDLPTCQAELTVTVPRDYEVVWGVLGMPEHKKLLTYDREEGKKTLHRWRLDGAGDSELARCENEWPHVRVTPHVRSVGKKDVRDIAVGNGWETVGQAYLGRIAKVFEADDAMKQTAASTARGSSDRREEIDRIYRHVQSSCRYLGLYEGMGGIIPEPADEVHELRFGDCKGLGTLLIALLRARDIDAHPVLVRTRDAGPLDLTVADMAQFNHYIVWADDGEGGMFLDATSDFCPAGILSPQNAAWPALLLHPERIGLVELPREAWDVGELSITVDGQLGEDGILDLSIQMAVTGNLAVAWRQVHSTGNGRLEELLEDILLPKTFPMRGSDHRVAVPEEWSEPVVAGLRAMSTAALPRDEERLFLPRILPPLESHLDDASPCATEIDLRTQLPRSETWRIELPAHVTIISPDSVTLAAPGLEWTRRVWQEGTTFQLARRLSWTEDFIAAEHLEKARDALTQRTRLESAYFELRWQQD